MILIVYNVLIVMLGLYCAANIAVAYKLRKLNHPWGKIKADSYTGNAIFALCGVLTAGFGPRPTHLSWWVVMLGLLGRIAMSAGMIRPLLLHFDFIKIPDATKGEEIK